MDERIKKVLASIFLVEISGIGDDASPETVEEWDSLKHMNIVLALEEEFDVQFEDDEIVDMMSYKDIRSIIKRKLND